MTTCRDLITRALRKTGDCAPNELPEGPQEDEAMVSLQAYYDQLVSDGVLGTVTDVLVSTDYEAGEWERVTATADVSVTLPATVTDRGGTLRPPQDGALIVLTLGSPGGSYLYDARTGSWTSLTGLTLDSVPPLLNFGLDGLACALAVQLASDNGRTVSPLTLQMAQSFRGKAARRTLSYRPSVPCDGPVLCMSRQTYAGWGWQ